MCAFYSQGEICQKSEILLIHSICALLQVVRGLIPDDVNHTQEVGIVGFSNNVVTFPSLLPLVEYSFTVNIRAGPYQQHPVVDGRQSQPVNFITPATGITVLNSTIINRYTVL